MNLLEHINYASRQLEGINKLRTAIGGALTTEQQLAVSGKIAGGPDAFIAWAATPVGRDMLRLLVDEFVATK